MNSKARDKPVLSKLKAIAALAYAKELELQNIRRAREERIEAREPNPLGI